MLDVCHDTVEICETVPREDGLFETVRDAVEELRPILRRDGGDMTLIAVEGDLVVIDLKGACVGCALSVVTVAGIRKKMSDAVGRPLRVVPLAALPSAMRQRFAA